MRSFSLGGLSLVARANVALGIFLGVFLGVILVGSRRVLDRIHRWRTAAMHLMTAFSRTLSLFSEEPAIA